MKKTLALILSALLLMTALTAPAAFAAEETGAQASPAVTASVMQDKKFSAAIVAVTPAKFEDAGFRLGDSCDITFSSGYTLRDVPYYNGYYVKDGAPVIVAYPGFKNIRITLNNMGIWDEAGLKREDTVTITLNQAGKYLPVQESLGQDYPSDRGEYDSDAAFCNFRALTGGSLKENFLYRGASPVDNRRGRASYTDRLLEEYGIQFILDLADSDENMAEYLRSDAYDSPYAAGLYETGCMSMLSLGNSFRSAEYRTRVAGGLREMMNSDGPVYIHCMEGKDRTGFVCMLLEALAGAGYTEMMNDYMLTYRNYYRVSEDQTPEKFNAVRQLYFDSFAACLYGDDDPDALLHADYSAGAAAYLLEGGMTAEEIEQLRAFICE